MSVLNFSITVPDAQATAILGDFCASHNFVQNGETKTAFAKRKIIEYIKESIKMYRTITEMEAIKTQTEQQIATIEAVKLQKAQEVDNIIMS
jgi:hypothetical protein